MDVLQPAPDIGPIPVTTALLNPKFVGIERSPGAIKTGSPGPTSIVKEQSVV